MSPALEVRHLLLVDAIADLGNVTRAAERLHLTQSALSHQLRDIESRLGAALFTRLSRRMALTPEGERVREAARRIIDELNRAEADVRGMHDPSRGLLRLCTQCNTGYHWLSPLLEGFHRKHPGVEIQIVVAATNRPLDALREGEIDLAVITDEDVADRGVRTRPLFADELVALVSPSHRLAGRAWIEAADFGPEHLILYQADRKNSYPFTRVLTPAGVEPAKVSQVPLTEAIVEMVKAGLGIAVLARWAVEPAIKAGTVKALKITRKGVRRHWSAATLTSRVDPPWLPDFLQLLSQRALPVRMARRA